MNSPAESNRCRGYPAETESDLKLAELILYIARISEGDDTFGSTKLNKILFMADFEAYRKLGSPITGAEYQSLPHGPAPRRLMPVMEKLCESGSAAVRIEQRFGYEQKRPIALREPDLSLFSADEIALVDRIVRLLWGFTARDVSELSHRFIGWQLAEQGEIIPYGLALLAADRELSEEGNKVAQELSEYAASLLP